MYLYLGPFQVLDILWPRINAEAAELTSEDAYLVQGCEAKFHTLLQIAIITDFCSSVTTGPAQSPSRVADYGLFYGFVSKQTDDRLNRPLMEFAYNRREVRHLQITGLSAERSCSHINSYRIA